MRVYAADFHQPVQGANTFTFSDLATTTYSAVRLNFAASGTISIDPSDERFSRTSVRSFDKKKDGNLAKYVAALAAGYLKGFVTAAYGTAASCSPTPGGKGGSLHHMQSAHARSCDGSSMHGTIPTSPRLMPNGLSLVQHCQSEVRHPSQHADAQG
jgi:hypothetical protein